MARFDAVAQTTDALTRLFEEAYHPDLIQTGLQVDFDVLRASQMQSPTGTTMLAARQRSPAQPKADSAMASRAWGMSASGMTKMKFLAPPRACTRLPWAAPVL